MRLTQAFAYVALAISAVNAASIPDTQALDRLEQPRVVRADVLAPENALEKRKGGGGKGGGGGSGGGKSGGGSSGGSTRGGAGPPRAYGGSYGGGAKRPFQSGGRTPKGLVAGALIAPAAVLLIMPGLWLYSVYPYHMNPYRFHNATRNGTNNNNNNNKRQADNGAEQTIPVTCLCSENALCGCDENDDPSYLDSLVGNGSYAALNKTLVTVSDVNGTETLVINGTLPPGTEAPSEDGAAANLRINRYAGYWVMVMIVVSMVTFL